MLTLLANSFLVATRMQDTRTARPLPPRDLGVSDQARWARRWDKWAGLW